MVNFYGKLVGKYSIHGASGQGKTQVELLSSGFFLVWGPSTKKTIRRKKHGAVGCVFEPLLWLFEFQLVKLQCAKSRYLMVTKLTKLNFMWPSCLMVGFFDAVLAYPSRKLIACF